MTFIPEPIHMTDMAVNQEFQIEPQSFPFGLEYEWQENSVCADGKQIETIVVDDHTPQIAGGTRN